MHRILRGARRALLSAVVLATLSACGGGGGSTSSSGGGVPPAAVNQPPSVSILGTGDVRPNAAGIGLGATLGGVVRLDASASSDPDNDALSFEWSLLAKPSGSTVTLSGINAKSLQFTPDVLGVYTVALKLNDGRGGQTTQQLSIAVDNQAPVGNVVVEPAFTAVPTEQSPQMMSVGGSALFNAEASTDPDGHPVTVRFELLSRPAGSVASLVIDAKRARLDADLVGSYRVKVVGSDGRASFESIHTLVADNRAPTPSITVQPSFTAVPVQLAPQRITVGGSVLVDASLSNDPEGDPVAIRFELLERPAMSAAAISQTGKQARFVADKDGTYRIKTIGTDGRASFEIVHVFVADNHVPTAVSVHSVAVTDNVSAAATVSGTVGYVTQLDSGGSTDPDNNISTRNWELVSRPAGSATLLSSTTAVTTNLAPDVLGDYVVKLTVTDALGARATKTTTVRVANRQPVAQISTNATPQALPSAPSIRVPRNTQLTLRGGNSLDADGDALTFLWTVDSKPAGSAAALSSSSATNPTVSVDVDGAYVFRLRVTDPAGAYSERTITVNVGAEAPVAVVDRSRLTLIAGSAAKASAALSFDRDGDALTYSWSIDARPAGSTATIATPNQAALNFVPDVVGTYVATVTVSDGRYSASAAVEIRALASVASTVSLGFTPIEARYSAGLDKIVLSTASPATLRIVDPATGLVESVVLPTAVKNFSLSPQGRLAAVLHEGLVSLVDLSTATVLQTASTGGSQTEAMVDDAGFIMLMGQTGGQWVTPEVVVMNGRTGMMVSQGLQYGRGTFYGTQYGIFAGRLNKGFVMSQGLSPSKISYFTIDPSTHALNGSGDSPYHGTYPMQSPLFLSESQDLVFTVMGNFFLSSDLTYGGQLTGLNVSVRSLSNNTAADETLVVDGPAVVYSWSTPSPLPSSYKRYTSRLMLPQADLPLPAIGGQQSYGLQVFHSSAGRHVLLVQTGSSTLKDATAQYHVITR